MRSISHRDLRNNSGEVLREVANGESFVVTNHGVAVARLIPTEQELDDLRCVRPARSRVDFAKLARRKPRRPTQATIDDLRGDR